MHTTKSQYHQLMCILWSSQFKCPWNMFHFWFCFQNVFCSCSHTTISVVFIPLPEHKCGFNDYLFFVARLDVFIVDVFFSSYTLCITRSRLYFCVHIFLLPSLWSLNLAELRDPVVNLLIVDLKYWNMNQSIYDQSYSKQLIEYRLPQKSNVSPMYSKGVRGKTL